MSALALVPLADRCPVRAGDTVRVPETQALPCGRRLRKGRYTVLRVETTPAEHRARGPWRVVVRATLDCSRLPRLYHRPSPEERAARSPVPLAAQPVKVLLYPSEFIADD